MPLNQVKVLFPPVMTRKLKHLAFHSDCYRLSCKYCHWLSTYLEHFTRFFKTLNDYLYYRSETGTLTDGTKHQWNSIAIHILMSLKFKQQ